MTRNNYENANPKRTEAWLNRKKRTEAGLTENFGWRTDGRRGRVWLATVDASPVDFSFNGVMQHTRSPWTNNVRLSSSRIPPILTTPCSTTILATTSSTSVWSAVCLQATAMVWWSSFSSTAVLPLFELAPWSVPSSCKVTPTSFAACFHKVTKNWLK